MPALSFDILEIIAEHLQSDTNALKAACVVAQEWRVIFQRVLFSTHTIIIPEVASYDLFLATIHNRPSLALHTRSLELLATEGPVNDIFVVLPLLRKVTISKSMKSWCHNVAPEFCNSLRQALQSEYLTSLTLHILMLFPLRILNGVTSLRHFSSYNTSFEDPSVEDSESQVQSPTALTGLQLHTLSLPRLSLDGYDLLQWLTDHKCFFELHELKSLEICDVRMNPKFSDLISLIPPTLEHLTYMPTWRSALSNEDALQITLNAFSLTKFSHLLTLTLSVTIPTGQGGLIYDYLPWCIAFLSTLPNPSKLQTFVIQSRFHTRFNPRSDSLSASWNELDTLLSSKKFSSLGRVSVYVPLEGRSNLFRSFKKVLVNNLPALKRKGSLEWGRTGSGIEYTYQYKMDDF